MFDPAIFWNALTSTALLLGLATTLSLAVLVQFVALIACLPLAVARSGPARALVHAYVWIFRGTPTLLVLLLAWNGLPQLVPALKSGWYTAFDAAFLALTLVQIAYLAEIMRAALLSVAGGQREAAAALGLHRLQAFRLVVLPQALRVAVPPVTNEFITLVKTTSLASVISLRELMTVAGYAITASFRFLEWYSAALVYYLVTVGLIGLGQAALERRLRRSR